VRHLKSFKNIDKQGLILCFLIVILLWIIVFQISRINGIQGLVRPDTAATLTYARSIAKGYPFRLYPGDLPGTALSDLISPFIYSIGYFIGFRSPDAFKVWAEILVLIFLLTGAFFLWRFFKKYVDDVLIPAVILSVVFPPVFVNMYSTNAGLLFIFFWGALAYLDSFPIFYTFSILAGLSRPEGFIIYSFLFFLRFTLIGDKKTRFLVPGYIILFMPFIIYKIITGHFLPQGVAPQSLFHSYSFWDAIFLGVKSTADILKGYFLSYFPFSEHAGLLGISGIGAFPPLMFILGLIGLITYRKSWGYAVFSLIILLSIGDGFTEFSGVHENRHIAFLAPFIIGYSLHFFKGLKREWKSYYHLFIGLTGIFLIFQNMAMFYTVHETAKRDVLRRRIAEKILKMKGNIPVIKETTGCYIDYWLDGNRKIINLTPALNPELGRYVVYYGRYTEYTEYLQNKIDSTGIFVDLLEKRPVQNWLRNFATGEKMVFKQGYIPYAEVYYVDLKRIKDSLPSGGKILAEIDVGDRLSEMKHNYRYFNDLDVYIGAPIEQGNGFYDGGRYVLVDEFDMKIPEGKSVLVMRIKGIYTGHRSDYNKRIKIDLSHKNSFNFYIDNEPISKFGIIVDTGFTYIRINIESKSEKSVQFRIEGKKNIFHYWLIKGD